MKRLALSSAICVALLSVIACTRQIDINVNVSVKHEGAEASSGTSSTSTTATATKSEPAKAAVSKSALAKSGNKKITVGYVTNGIDPFWTIAEAGALAAGKEFDAQVHIRMPPSDSPIANQKRMLEELLTLRVDGIAVSPINPEDQQDILNAIGNQCFFITHDSDAPQTNRLAYIGMSNYEAGLMCGRLIKEAIPDGGNVMIFVGRLDQLNARQRRQGVIDELLGRPQDATRFDPPDVGALKGEKYTVLDTRTDNFDSVQAKAVVEDAIVKYQDLNCMVGLFAYNPPAILEALKGANKVGKIKVVGFDEQAATLQAILDGHCTGTIVQNPYMYGYESVRMLTALARGDKSVLPEGGFMNIQARTIKKDNVQEFWTELKKRVGSG
jgi:ribose transport system substrate-binding protein